MGRLASIANRAILLVLVVLCGGILSALVSWLRYPVNEGSLVLVIVLSAVLAVGVFGLTRSASWRMRYVLLVLSLGGSLVAVEMGLWLRSGPEWAVKEGPHARAARLAGMPFDARTRFEVVYDLREAGVEAYPAFFASYWIEGRGNLVWQEDIYPLNGISEARTVYCNESGAYSTYLSDEHGFTNPTGLYVPGTVDVALIGDSFTQGACLQCGENIGDRFRQAGTQTVNFGLGGNGPLSELATIREFVAPLEPQWVLWMYYEGNDLDNLENERDNHMLMRYLNGPFSQDLYHRQDEIDRVLKRYVEAEFRLRVRGRGQGALSRITTFYHLRGLSHRSVMRGVAGPAARLSLNPPFTLFAEVLREAEATVSQWGGRLVFVYLPEFDRYELDDANSGLHRHRQRVLETARRLDLQVIDVHASFRDHPNPQSLFPFEIHGHYNAEGADLVARTTLAAVEHLDRQLDIGRALDPSLQRLVRQAPRIIRSDRSPR